MALVLYCAALLFIVNAFKCFQVAYYHLLRECNYPITRFHFDVEVFKNKVTLDIRHTLTSRPYCIGAAWEVT